MGDRANCIVHQNSFDKDAKPVWLYTHWDGHDLLAMVQEALQRRQRWDDEPYLTRIIFDTMSKNQQGEETGFGISTTQPDNEHDFIVVDPGKQEVRLEDQSDHSVKETWSFEDFCQVDISAVNY